MSDLRELSQSQVPLERVAPLHSNRLVTFVNHFIVSIVQQLNELSSVVDSRLFDINNQIVRCNTNLVILEMKLNSISGLSSVSGVVNGETSEPIATTTNTSTSNGPHGQHHPTQTLQTEFHIDNNSEEAADASNNELNKTEPNDMTPVKEESDERESEPEDPRLAKYKKMVQLGIPLAAVHQKMSLEGVDTQLLSWFMNNIVSTIC